jgi:DNA-binding response OmpR family regulator
MNKILIIEDNTEISELLHDLLVREKYEVLISYDGIQGTEFTHKFKPDLILLDLMLPAGGGFYVLDKVKLSSLTKHIPIVVLTASKDTEHRNRAIKMGVDAFLEKPYEPQVLLSTIRGLISGQKNGIK